MCVAGPKEAKDKLLHGELIRVATKYPNIPFARIVYTGLDFSLTGRKAVPFLQSHLVL